jgi:methylmalonyl-CoA/ethylmalonyl-CoA epimerase
VEGLGIHHLGIAVASLDDALVTYAALFGARVEHREVVPEQGVEVASVVVGGSRLELLAALDADTPVGRFIAKRGPGLHHVAFAVADLEGELVRLAREGVRLIDQEPRRGFFGFEIAFVHPEATGGVLAEFVGDVRG